MAGSITTLGALAASGFADGTLVEVLIRPEALKLSPADVAGARSRRASWPRACSAAAWIHLSLVDPAAGHAEGPREGQAGYFHFHARVPGRFVPREGEILAVGLEPAQAFVFPARLPS